ncbi:unnamed protein product, partial [Iphiclides podalirius]
MLKKKKRERDRERGSPETGTTPSAMAVRRTLDRTGPSARSFAGAFAADHRASGGASSHLVFVESPCRKEAAAGGPSPMGHAYTKHFVIHKDKRKIKICKALGTGRALLRGRVARTRRGRDAVCRQIGVPFNVAKLIGLRVEWARIRWRGSARVSARCGGGLAGTPPGPRQLRPERPQTPGPNPRGAAVSTTAQRHASSGALR